MKRAILVLLALACVLTLVGCPKDVELGAKVGEWKGAAKYAGKPGNTLEIKADNEDIDWWVLTDMDGVVYQPSASTFTVQTGTYKGVITKGTSASVKFHNDSTRNKFVLYIHQSKVAHDGKDEDKQPLTAGSRSFRGSFVVGKNQSATLKASDYKEAIPTVGTIVLKNNECSAGTTKSGCKPGSWHGDYTITEVWPLGQKKDSPEWEAISGKKYLNLSVKSGEEIELILPSGNMVFAINQPNRFTDDDKKVLYDSGSKAGQNKYEEQKDWYWCAKFENGGSGANGVYAPLGIGKTATVESYNCKWYFDLSDGTLTESKSAYDVTYIKDSDIIWAGDVK